MQQQAGSRVSSCVKPNDPGDAAAVCLPGATRPRRETGDSAEVAVSALYQASAVSDWRFEDSAPAKAAFRRAMTGG